MRRYNPKEIEPKWQKSWLDNGTYSTDLSSEKPKYIGFGMFNYPSGAGIHVGHVRNYTIPDVITRYKRQKGYESYQAVGWDSFGLPAENYAIKTGVPPQISTKEAIAKYHKQYQAMGWAVDWSKEINTTDPEYYKWTQWIFSKLFEQGLAYQKESPQWWCNQCMTVLADEQVLAGKCWRHDGEDDPLVTKKNLKQWFFKITEYADEILQATDELDWTESVKASQKSWIGRSEGAEIKFAIKDSASSVQAFTTRPDTLYGATFMVIAPEHPLVDEITTDKHKSAVEQYVKQAQIKSDIERQEGDSDKTGVFTGTYAINPINNQEMPIWIADYVLMGYGTGAIMAVPAHDERDYTFAKAFELPAVDAVVPINKADKDSDLFTGDGELINSGKYNGMNSAKAREAIVADLKKAHQASAKVQYKMRDWLISRQRYWGAPIPIIHCNDCGPVAVPEEDLPVELPEIENYKPTGGNVSVLAGVEDWVNVVCPTCDQPAKRETDTMDGYVCSSWYFLRYISPHDSSQAWDTELVKKWLPVDFYNGGDHATAHLLYARFFMRFFYKLGLVGAPEPFEQMVYNGKVRASDGSMFSKSKGNGVDPLEVIESGYGADALRLYEMFAAPVELDVLWDPQGIPGAHRFLSRVWTLAHEFLSKKTGETDNQVTQELLFVAHSTIKKVTNDIEQHKFNTAIASMMAAVNEYYKIKQANKIEQSEQWRFAISSLLQLLAPFAPHMTEELWHEVGQNDSIHHSSWPEHNESYLTQDKITIVIQVNGKVRANIEVPADAQKDDIVTQAKANDRVAEYLQSGDVLKTIYVPQRLINFVVAQK
jgi:leucyl-tRNA synthetase